MILSEFRNDRGWTLEQLAAELGLQPSSKGHLSRIESGADCPLGLALRIEKLSVGVVPARSISSEARAIGAGIVTEAAA